MERKDNYVIQAMQAKQHFLTYDQQELTEKLHLQGDETYLYIPMLCQTYRIRRRDGFLERQASVGWMPTVTKK